MSEKKEVAIYTRGVGSLTGAGGHAAIVLCNGHRKELFGGTHCASNNRMDIRAAIEGLKALKHPCRITLYNNNTYLVDAIAKGWAVKWRACGWTNSDKKPTPNADLWEELLVLCSIHEVSFLYRRLDGKDCESARCGLLAHEASKSNEIAQDKTFER